MLELRFAGAWRFASVMGLLLVLIATLVPSEWLWPDDAAGLLEIGDKWLHGIAFMLLSIWFCGQYRRSSYWRIVAGLVAFGVLIEICQRAVSYRSAEYLDLAADVTGIAAGLGVAMAGAGGWSLRFEGWLGNRIG